MPEKNKIGKIRIAILFACVIALIYMVSILFDNQTDMRACFDEFKAVTGITPDSAFANKDYWVLNFGKNISCDVFWYEGRFFYFMPFASGTLTYEKYQEKKP
jgi:hypothetical protein